MATYADLTNEQQEEYSQIMLEHHLALRRLLWRKARYTEPEDQAAVQVDIDAKIAVEPTVDGYLGV